MARLAGSVFGSDRGTAQPSSNSFVNASCPEPSDARGLRQSHQSHDARTMTSMTSSSAGAFLLAASIAACGGAAAATTGTVTPTTTTLGPPALTALPLGDGK